MMYSYLQSIQSMGKNCCIPGCTNYQKKTKKSNLPDCRLATHQLDHNYSPSVTSGAASLVSYVSFPRAGISPTQDEWRKKLIHAASRADSKFNAVTHHMCTCHFLEIDLLFHGKPYFFTLPLCLYHVYIPKIEIRQTFSISMLYPNTLL